MFGIVTAFGLDNPVIGSVEPTDPTVPQTPVEPVVTPTAPPVQIVVHRVPSTAPAPVVDTTGSSEVAITDAASAAVVPDAPVQLTANPVVQTVTVAAPSQPQQSSQPQASSAPAAAPTPAPATTKGSG